MDYRDIITKELPRAVTAAVRKRDEFESSGGLTGLREKFRRMSVTMDLMESLERIRATRELIPAIPTDEPIGSVINSPKVTGETSIVGIDGSQIYPSDNAAVQWAYVRALATSGDRNIETGRLFTPEDLFGDTQTETLKRKVDGWREAFESEMVAQSAEDPEWSNHIILTDGSLLPWSGMEKSMSDISDIYRSNMQRAKGRLVAGVISSPRSRYCMNLLRAAFRAEGKADLTIPVTDADFFREFLKVGQRTAIFLHGSPVNDDFNAAVHLFYLKVSRDEVFRIEIPSWVAHDSVKTSQLHAALIQDSGGLEYPYSLIKAHDLVKISQEVSQGLQEQADRDFYKSHGGPLILPAKVRLKNAYAR